MFHSLSCLHSLTKKFLVSCRLPQITQHVFLTKKKIISQPLAVRGRKNKFFERNIMPCRQASSAKKDYVQTTEAVE